MIAEYFAQDTPEWREARRGIPTSSNFDKLITTTGKPSTQRKKYMYQLSADRITGIKEDKYKNGDMQRGIELEPEARSMYELMNDIEVKTVGICYRDEKKLYACSPDGLVGDDGLVEIKCPSSPVHIGYLLADKMPTEYINQVQGQLFVTGRKWVDFFSYYPGLKPLCLRVLPDEKFAKALQVELEVFCRELDEITKKLRGI